MSELFDDDPRETPPPARREPRRSRALIITAVVVVLGFFGLTTFAGLYTDRLWYSHVGYSEVFTHAVLDQDRAVPRLRAADGASSSASTCYLAYRLRPLFRPSSPEQTGLDRYRDAVTPIRTWLLIGVSLVLGAFAGSSAVGQWRHYLLWRNGVPFGSNDAYFHKDIGFYVFDLPWLHYLVDFTMAVTVVALIAAAVVHYLYGGVRLQTSHDRLSGAAQAQLSVLLGVFVLAKAADYWLDRFDLVTQCGGLITGMTYTDDHAVLPAKNILMGIAVICAVLFFLNVWRRTWLLPSVGLALLALSAILLGLIWPGIVQQFQVKPSEADKEAPYIEKNIEATRAAYDLEDVETHDVHRAPVGDERPAARAAARTPRRCRWSTRSWCARPSSRTSRRAPTTRSPTSSTSTATRSTASTGPSCSACASSTRAASTASDRNWSNLHTVYTHGNGIIAAYANQRPADNKPESTDIQWAEGQPSRTSPLAQHAPAATRPRSTSASRAPTTRSSASSPAPRDVELDLRRRPRHAGDAQDPTTTYAGKGGVPVGSFFNQLMYAVKFGEPNFLLSERVNGNSEVLYNRNPRDRVEKVAPWLTIDSDPYPAVVDGRIQWILDGYTTTDRYPLVGAGVVRRR